MKIFRHILTCSLIFFSILLSQSSTIYTEYHLIQRSPAAALSKIGVESWLAGSAGVTDTGFLSSSFNNPGALRVTSVKASAEFTYRMKARYFDLMDYDDIFYPSFFSVAYGDERMNYGFSYFRQFSQYIQSDPIPMTTVDQPEGTGEFLQFSTDVDIQSYAGTAQYALSNKIGIGMTVGGNYLTNRDELGRNYVTVSGWSFLAITGVHAKFDELTVGASVRYSSPFSSWNEETKLKLIRVLEPTGEIITTKYFARLPIVYQVGISYQIQPSFRISVSDEIQDWSFVGLQYKEISNIHIGITATVSEYLDLLLGYSEQFDAQNGVTDLKFFTAGITVHAELITFTAGVSDSKMFSKTKVPWYSYPPKEPFRQFILLSGLTYSF